MAKEEPFIDRADAERVRREIGAAGEAALAILKDELEEYRQLQKLPKRWCDNFKTVADQLRRDYRLEPGQGSGFGGQGSDPGPDPGSREPAEPADPLEGLRLVSDDEAA